MDDDEVPPDRKGPKPKHLEPNHNRYRRSRKHEERLAEKLGGRRLPNSGGRALSRWVKVLKVSDVSFKGEKMKEGFETVTLDGDVANAEYHFEHKRTEKDSMAVKKEWWVKVCDGARTHGTVPALILTFEANKLNVPLIEMVCVPIDVFEKLAGQKVAKAR